MSLVRCVGSSEMSVVCGVSLLGSIVDEACECHGTDAVCSVLVVTWSMVESDGVLAWVDRGTDTLDVGCAWENCCLGCSGVLLCGCSCCDVSVGGGC